MALFLAYEKRIKEHCVGLLEQDQYFDSMDGRINGRQTWELQFGGTVPYDSRFESGGNE